MFYLEEDFAVAVSRGEHIASGLKEVEARYMEHVYRQARYNQSKAAIMLGMSRGTFRTKMKEYFNDEYIK